MEEHGAGTDPNDGDTLRDDAELAGAGSRPPTDPTEVDTDGDGLSDSVETSTGTFVSPTDTGSDPTMADSDRDGLGDSDEVQGNNPANFSSDPNLADTDGDGFGDGEEVRSGHDPNSAADFPTEIFIGDVPDQGGNIFQATIGPDSSNGGNITCAFFSDPSLNQSESEQSFLVTGVNFQSTTMGTLTPFVAIFDPTNASLGANYSVVAIGDPIDGVAGLNNADFTVGGENPVISVGAGGRLSPISRYGAVGVAGRFRQRLSQQLRRGRK